VFFAISTLVFLCLSDRALGNVEAVVDDSNNSELAASFETEEYEDKINLEEGEEEEGKLPRSEKSLLGSFHSSYNPQPLNRLQLSNGGQQEADINHETVTQQNYGHSHHDQEHHYHDYHDLNEPHDHHEYNGHRIKHDHHDQKRNLLKFPFEKVDPSKNELPSHNKVPDEAGIGALEKATLAHLEVLDAGDDGRKCVNKVMMREETEYDEVLTCDHSYDNRCHNSYVTKYEPHQEEVCEEKFRKICMIDYEQKANQEVVQVCKTPIIPDCNIPGPEVCKTVWTSECSTVQIVHEVEDDIANCETIEEEKCEDVTEGFRTQRKCDTWPKEKCTLDKKKVKKYTPQTSCSKVSQKACMPRGCGLKEGPVKCHDKVQTVVSENPVENCDMEPLRTCKHVTKLVPKLDTVQECVDVPKEICARSKVNPRRVKKPSIQKWCFTPGEENNNLLDVQGAQGGGGGF